MCLLVCGLQVPLILTTSFPDAVTKPLEAAIGSIKSKQYQLVLSSELVQSEHELSREESALVGYYLDADRFCGNSVSTLSAMLILERQWLNRCTCSWLGSLLRLPYAAWGRHAFAQHLAVRHAQLFTLGTVLAHCPQVLGALQWWTHTVEHVHAVLSSVN